MDRTQHMLLCIVLVPAFVLTPLEAQLVLQVSIDRKNKVQGNCGKEIIAVMQYLQKSCHSCFGAVARK